MLLPRSFLLGHHSPVRHGIRPLTVFWQKLPRIRWERVARPVRRSLRSHAPGAPLASLRPLRSQKALPGDQRLPLPLQVSAGHAKASGSKGAARDISGNSGHPQAPPGDSQAAHGSLTESQSIPGESRVAMDSWAACSIRGSSGSSLEDSRASSNSQAIPGSLE